MAIAVGPKATQVSAPSGDMQTFFGRKTLKLVKPWVVRLVADEGKRGA
jgi:hypothetical protein